MYAVIRTGGKQYLVSPGERLKIERTGTTEGAIEFSDVLAVSPEAGKFATDLAGAKVTGTVLGQGRGDKILVFKLKRKKQYKKMQGHRQNFVEVRINEILVNGKSFKAEGDEAEAPKAEKKHAEKHMEKHAEKHAEKHTEKHAEKHAEKHTEKRAEKHAKSTEAAAE